jgi:DNA invertase Pin-like site-specific DNA recombinase
LLRFEKLLKFATRAEKQINAFDSEIFEDFIEEIIVFSQEEIGFKMKCGVELKGKAGEIMSHIPFGYTIQNGRAVVNEEEAVKIKKLFEVYLSGLSLSEAAQKAGIKRYHASVARMLAE